MIYDWFKHTYAFEKDGHKIVLTPLKLDLNALHVQRKVNHLLRNGGSLEKVSTDHQVAIFKDEFKGDLSQSLQIFFFFL